MRNFIYNYVFFLLFLCVTQYGYAQKVFNSSVKIPDKQQAIKIRNHLRDYTLLEFDKKGLDQYVKGKSGEIKLTLLFGERKFDMTIYPNEIRSEQYVEALNDVPLEGQVINEETCITYAGYINSNPENYIRLTITDKILEGYIATKDGFVFIDRMTKFSIGNQEDNQIIVYNQNDIITNSEDVCGVTALQEQNFLSEFESFSSQSSIASVTTSCRILELATDADFEFRQRYGVNSNNEILGIINMIQGVYVNTFDMDVRVVFQNVWTTSADPYTGDPTTDAGSQQLVNELRNHWEGNRANVRRDLVHLFTGRGFNLAGVTGRVYEIGTVCRSRSTSYGFTRDRTDQFETTAHEIGHNFGGVHTDGINCGTTNASVMCQGDKRNNLYFSNASITRMENFISANSGCLLQLDNIELTGKFLVCNSGTSSYTLTTPLQGSVTWSLNNTNFSVYSGQGTRTVTLRGKSSGSGKTRLTATINTGGACNTVTISKDIYVGAFTTSDITVTGATGVCPGNLYNYTANVPGGHSNAYTYTWSFPSGWSINSQSYNSISLYVPAGNTQGGAVRVSVNNTCGTTPYTGITVYPGFSCSSLMAGEFVIYPNPADEELTIEQVTEQDSVSSTNNEQLQIVLRNTSLQQETFNVELYDKAQTVVAPAISKNGKISLNTSKLPAGTYFLHIYYQDAISQKQIIIE